MVKCGDAVSVNQCLVNACAVAGFNGKEELMTLSKRRCTTLMNMCLLHHTFAVD